MSRALVCRLGKNPQPVKNLGWLLRNARHALHITVIPIGREGDCSVRVDLHGDVVFLVDFADYNVCWSWFKRPSFVGVPIKWGNQPYYR